MAASEARTAKKAKLELDFDFSDSESDAGVQLPQTNGFKINEEYAKRFEYNKKREERHRLEEKYGNGDSNKRKRNEDDASDESHGSSSDESEDDEAELATAELDDEIMATLNLIRNKDPKRLDQNARFYKEFDPESTVSGVGGGKKEAKPMTLQDYQREKLLAGNLEEDNEEDEPMQTYAEEQEQLKRELIGSMHATARDNSDSDNEEGFMVKKTRSRHENTLGVTKEKKPAKRLTDQDIALADKDPETYLSNFMAARAWLPGDGARFQPLESDDSDDDKRAEEFEEAYNMRFEDPAKSNEKLQSFARDSGKYGVRREEKSGRARQRERERAQKEAERREREEGMARLRKLKVEEVEEKIKRIKEAAGLQGKELKLDAWRDILEGDFDNEQWEAEMKSRFGEDYYAEGEAESASDAEQTLVRKHKPRKPKFDDDIDINDLIPDFDASNKPNITLSDDEDEDGGAPVPPSDGDESDAPSGKKKKTKKDRLKEKSDAKRAARKERMAIEEMVDAALPLQHPALTTASSSKAPVTGFRYRETSPTSFGLSARDILFADDTALNSFAGLKKMAAFRDEEKKIRDKKKFSKKARLRQWRKETFGTIDEPTGGFENVLGNELVETHDRPKKHSSRAVDKNIVDGKRKRKRSKKKAKIDTV